MVKRATTPRRAKTTTPKRTTGARAKAIPKAKPQPKPKATPPPAIDLLDDDGWEKWPESPPRKRKQPATKRTVSIDLVDAPLAWYANDALEYEPPPMVNAVGEIVSPRYASPRAASPRYASPKHHSGSTSPVQRFSSPKRPDINNDGEQPFGVAAGGSMSSDSEMMHIGTVTLPITLPATYDQYTPQLSDEMDQVDTTVTTTTTTTTTTTPTSTTAEQEPVRSTATPRELPIPVSIQNNDSEIRFVSSESPDQVLLTVALSAEQMPLLSGIASLNYSHPDALPVDNPLSEAESKKRTRSKWRTDGQTALCCCLRWNCQIVAFEPVPTIELQVSTARHGNTVREPVTYRGRDIHAFMHAHWLISNAR
jgi:hypothetical protein